MTKLNDKDQELIEENSYSEQGAMGGRAINVVRVENMLIQKDAEHKAEIDELKANELKSDLLVMCNARRLIKAHKRTSNGRLASELFGMGCGSGRDYCRKLNLDPDSNETNYSDAINQLKDK